MDNLASFANTKKPQHNNMALFGINLLLDTPQSLTPQGFQRFCEGCQVFTAIWHEKNPVFAKAAKCECWGILVAHFEKMEAKNDN